MMKLTLSFGHTTSQRCQDRNILDITRQFAMVFQAPLVSQKDKDHAQNTLETPAFSFGLGSAWSDRAIGLG